VLEATVNERDPSAEKAAPPADPAVSAALPSLPTPQPAARAGERGVETTDALTHYMAQLRHYAPIPREEEQRLALRWVEHRDLDAARQLVLANLRLVVKIAMEYRRAWTNVLDLIQEGNLGLLQATQRFDPYKGVKLSSYAVYWIRAYILKYILDNIRLVRLGKTRAERKLFFRLNKEKRELERLGFEIEPKLLAERLEVSESDVIDMEQRLARGELSLQAPAYTDDDKREIGDLIPSGGASVEQGVADAELRRVFMERVREFAKTLDERDRRIVDARILADEPLSLQELGTEFGVSRERVRQLEARIVSQLREHLKRNLVDFEYYAANKE
jgi:RNA polymerase sigma-32 factor